jgi:glycosyltransferase involved in cell wall biosynthesis
VRVMLLVTDLQLGGTPLRLARLARGLRDGGLEVRVGSLAPAGPVSAELESAGIATFACNARHARDLAALQRLVRHVQSIRPHLIHATLTHANVAARFVGLLCRVPVLSSTATIEVERRWHLWIERLTARLDRGHIVNSRALADHVAHAFCLPHGRIHVVPPSIAAVPRRMDRGQARQRLGIAEHEFVTLWVGRFDPVKRLDIAIRCAEVMNAVRSRLLLAGDGPHRPAVEQMVRLSAAARSIQLLGWQTDLGPVMSAADAFLFPSLTEGMPSAVLQAMAFGLPIVGSDIPALRELAGDEPRLLLVDRGEPKAYADALLSLRDDPERARALANHAATWARENLDARKTVRTLVGVYERVLKRRAARPGCV